MVSQLYFHYLLGLSINSGPHKGRCRPSDHHIFIRKDEHLCRLILEMSLQRNDVITYFARSRIFRRLEAFSKIVHGPGSMFHK